MKDASVVDEVPTRQIVRRVNDDIVFPHYFHSIARVKPDWVSGDSDLRIDEAKLLLGRVDFSPSQVWLREHELSLKVRHLNEVRVSDPDPAYSGGREIDCGWNSKAPESHDQYRGALESTLPLGSHLREDEMSAVSLRFTST